MGEWINKEWYVYMVRYQSVTKRSKVLIYAIMWMNLDNIMLREGSQTQKVIYYMIPFIQNAQKRQVYRDKSRPTAVQEYGQEKGLTAKGHKRNLGSVGNVLKCEYGDIWTTLEI